MAHNSAYLNRLNNAYFKIDNIIKKATPYSYAFKRVTKWENLIYTFGRKYNIRVASRARRGTNGRDVLAVIANLEGGKLRELEQLAAEMYPALSINVSQIQKES